MLNLKQNKQTKNIVDILAFTEQKNNPTFKNYVSGLAQ